MGNLFGSFLESMRVRTKQEKMTCVGLLGQLAVLKAVWDITVVVLELDAACHRPKPYMMVQTPIT
jgi:hypothetical protein